MRVHATVIDLVLFSGDVTAQALQSEYDLSRRELDPILTSLPSMMVQGMIAAYSALCLPVSMTHLAL